MAWLIILVSLVVAMYCEPDEVIVQVLYKPKECKEVGQHGDIMHVQYLGRFYESKKVFDSSYRRNNVPFYYTLGVGGVIEGYQIGTKEMCINERRRLIVPSKYAYGKDGTGNIPGYSTLMFDVHLVQIGNSPPDFEVPLDLPMETVSDGKQDCKNPVKVGDLVEIMYIGSLPDGNVFDNGSTPLQFIVGAGQILQGIDEGIVGFCKESTIVMEIPPSKAYGDRWEGPVPQWSYVYYNVTITQHTVRDEIEDGEMGLQCESVYMPEKSDIDYELKSGDYIQLSYKIFGNKKEPLGEGQIRYPIGRKLIVPGWDIALQGSRLGQIKMCWIPSLLAHKIGTPLHLAFPEKGFYSELEISDILLTADNRDVIDLARELTDEIKMQTNSDSVSTEKVILNTAPTHIEL